MYVCMCVCICCNACYVYVPEHPQQLKGAEIYLCFKEAAFNAYYACMCEVCGFNLIKLKFQYELMVYFF